MTILVLGSAAGGGFPQWNCACEGCRRARSGDPAARPRTQSSLAVTADGERWLLLNASPDLGAQLLASPALHPRTGPRGNPIAAALLTNADIDHVAGLLTLRESHPFAVYATPRVHGVLAANPVFNVLNPDLVARRPVALGTPFQPADAAGRPLGLEVEAFAVPGKVALYLEDASAGPGFGSVAEDTVALRIRPTDGSSDGFFYIPGCAAMPGWLADRLFGAPLVFFDGTTWTDDEMVRTGTGTKTAARMGHMAMSGPEGSLAAFAGLDVARKVYIHINNTNPALLEDSPERREAEAAGWRIAHDGMELTL
ncbi:pyrroloquinoline quinone biosynthesis protein PqqB [Azospirillum sp. TSO35-2]|uniref:pyrroloquinoline quinone biosynthesis protein PqqB n=1 Tax=Azospirillum sp. TSO35-2 TaxID=716796 RepID=UPI000D6074FE|nr:pyrroloquinoline quinone biosynthesis protein PqqB [Azospirillum sp. TSO35-2]PWC34520.1 pyrroloquinoline quinone biosynthesis protein PqqB [Azospirillum sp. TSO35-2]